MRLVWLLPRSKRAPMGSVNDAKRRFRESAWMLFLGPACAGHASPKRKPPGMMGRRLSKMRLKGSQIVHFGICRERFQMWAMRTSWRRVRNPGMDFQCRIVGRGRDPSRPTPTSELAADVPPYDGLFLFLFTAERTPGRSSGIAISPFLTALPSTKRRMKCRAWSGRIPD
jgi:hypothetical protein